MKSMKAYYLTIAVWGNLIGYILSKIVGKHYDSSHEWDKSIVTSIDNDTHRNLSDSSNGHSWSVLLYL